ncbi:MAG TPA: ABC transporter permease [Candidatus Acidoferrales bacterium]|nr:ABC transporter permease [Candidatus Acidoferrales bacterium]
MMADLGAILWKELKEIPQQSSGRRGGPFALLIVLAVFGIFIPLQWGADFLDSGQMAFVVLLPVILIAAVIADAFAGERERHTLETLLASPLSDRSILLGKVAAAVAWGWGASLLCLGLSVATVNFKYGHGKLLIFSAQTGAIVIGMSFLLSVLMASAGVLVSLRASTVRQAQQILSIGFMVIVFGIFFIVRSLPRAWQEWMSQKGASTGASTLIILGLAVFLVIDIAILASAMMRFRRSRLIIE